MTACEETQTLPNVLDVTDIDNNSSENVQAEFYSPLCKSGYLTPLQRKKFREKRRLDASDCREDVDLRNFKKIKSRIPKIKKEGIGSKRKQIYPKKITGNVPQVRCAVAKIFTKTTVDNGKEKKFFKSSPSSRLEKANFTMPFVWKKNMFTNFDKVIKDLHSGPRKAFLLKESSSLECPNREEEEDLSAECAHPCVVKIVPLECVPGTDEGENGSALPDIAKEKNENVLQLPASEQERSHFVFEWPSDDIFLQRQERARALKRQSILKEPNTQIKNLKPEKINNAHESGAPIKFYPLFDIPKRRRKIQTEASKRSEKTSTPKYTKDSSRGGEQTVIDAGQKEMGPKVCHACGMIYTIGHEEDERLHSDYHNIYLNNLRFPGWKEESVVGEYCDGRVIVVRQDDKGWMLKKVEDVLAVANRDLGFPTALFPSKPDVTFVLFISNERRVAGCIVAEPIVSASRVLLAEDESDLRHLDDSERKVWRIGNWYSSSESVPAVCGINRIWVSQEFRRRKVASRMVDCLRCHFVHGHVVGIRELAFTDPSPDGREFAAVYTGTDHFLVYK